MSFAHADEYVRFRKSVLYNQRFIHEPSVEAFLLEMQVSSASRTVQVPAGSFFWRAQLGHTYRWQDKGESEEIEIQCAYDPARMKPDARYVQDGRVNPRGIAYLYLATNQNTACSEVRPWLDASISVGQFRTCRDLKLVDFTRDKKRWFKALGMDGVVPWDESDYESVVWGDTGHAMSEPVQTSEAALNYVPTQVIAEALRSSGANGLIYRSLLGEDGFNVVLFDVADAELRNCQLMTTSKILCEFKQSDNPYFL